MPAIERGQEVLVARNSGMSLEQAKVVLSHMQVPDEGDLYVLGCFEKRVTLRSQQVRALNLICSLYTVGALQDKSRIAVVGERCVGADCGSWLHPHIHD